MQERLERSAPGRVALSLFAVVTLAAVAVWNLPPSELRAQSLRALGPYVEVVGLDQNWGVFAPDPRRQTIGLRARIEYADGTTRLWHMPAGGDLVGGYWDYRWRKWMEYVTNEQYEFLRRPAAEWIARGEQAAGLEPERVTLIRRSTDIPPPGSAANALPPVETEVELYTLRLESRSRAAP